MSLAETASLLAIPFATGCAVLLTHVPLGQAVLKRGIVFVDLAVAQVAGIGVLVGHMLGLEGALAQQAAAFGPALALAILLGWAEHWWGDVAEALIGCIFVLAACAALLLVGAGPEGGSHLQEALSGQILWASPQQALWCAAAGAVIAGIWFWGGVRQGVGFYVCLAAAVTISVQLVGVYLVFASLILPALGSRRARHGLLVGYGIGLVGYGAGMAISVLGNWPTGPVIVWMLAAAALAAALTRRMA